MRATVAAGVAMLAASSLAACGGAATTSVHGRIAVVAGEDTWGSVARAVGAGAVTVRSIITSPSADPHTYTANAADAAAVAGARLVIENGANYDNFLGQLVGASGGSPKVLDVASLLGATASDVNPHFWYSPRYVRRVAAAIEADLAAIDPSRAAALEANLRAFDATLAPLDGAVAEIRSRYAGTPVAYTERVPGYLLADAGLVVSTPPGYARAVEQGTQPSFQDQLAMSRLLAAGRAAVLLYNTQTVSAVTDQAVAEARGAHVPTVRVGETLPPGAHALVPWLIGEARALLGALGRRG